MTIEILACLLLIWGVALAGAPWMRRSGFDPAESLVAGAVLSLTAAWVVAWVGYGLGFTADSAWILPAVAAASLIAGRGRLAALFQDPEARGLAYGQVLVTGWCLGWQSLVENYSGGGWAGDWFEHWERALFFLGHWPRNHLFLRIYPLPARPPLANILTAVFLALTRVDFSHFQVIAAVLASLAFLPAALLARRFGGRRAPSIFVVALLASPLFVENATFPWTKLPAAFFILSGLYFLLRTNDREGPVSPAALVAGTALAAGLLAHYSAGPYLVVLASAQAALALRRRQDRRFLRACALAAGAGALVAATWFAWAFEAYGVRATLLSNTSVTAGVPWRGRVGTKIALNLRDTLVPPFLRSHDLSLIAQTSRSGHWRDWLFQCYQVNLPLAFGCVAWIVLLRELARAAWAARASDRGGVAYWSWFIGGVGVLGVAVHGARDEWGLAHICLQPLVLAGLAFLAGRWKGLGRGWRIALAAGAAVDLSLGIVLQFAIESYFLDRWRHPGGSLADYAAAYNESQRLNLAGKSFYRLQFLSDVFTPRPEVVLALLAAILILALVRVRFPVSRLSGNRPIAP